MKHNKTVISTVIGAAILSVSTFLLGCSNLEDAPNKDSAPIARVAKNKKFNTIVIINHHDDKTTLHHDTVITFREGYVEGNYMVYESFFRTDNAKQRDKILSIGVPIAKFYQTSVPYYYCWLKVYLRDLKRVVGVETSARGTKKYVLWDRGRG